MAQASLNSRKAQVVWAIIPIALAGFVLELPFIWRALKTKKGGDVMAAIGFGIAQIAVYVAIASDDGEQGEVSNVTGAVVWFCAFAAAVGAAYLYRPLSKEERMDQIAQDTRPGSTYLR
ncbi:hypothetical protein ACIHCX_02100 [Streptomyces sp. NPDC052043]|uniref:hypothetical protein n=1 Tax=Streptomyces sp. NPDC052043 TaxID=3365684 RepID=UPI0037D428B6